MKLIKHYYDKIFGSYDTKEQFSIKKGYRHRLIVPQFDDTLNKDEWQNEVYEFAFHLFAKNNFKSVLDIGCGSGYKIIKYFSNYDFVGIEINSTLEFLKNTYPQYNWCDWQSIKYKTKFDLVIFSDVIEHLKDPGLFLNQIHDKLEFEYMIISTPERDIVRGYKDYGPPENIHHFREWNQSEFNDFISEYFDIHDSFISNYSQGTLLVLCKKK